MLTNTDLVYYCKDVYAHEWVYWYGTYGKPCTEALYQSKKKQYPTHYTENRVAGYQRDIKEKRWCADCVGMIKSFFWTGGKFGTEPKYASNDCPDVSANGMIDLCKVKGDIKTIPDIPGLVVWKSGHIGVYVGNGYTIEMRGFAYDCQRRKLSDGPWTKWGMLPMLDYGDKPVEKPAETVTRMLKRGCKGDDVAELQRNLIKLGYDCGHWGADGDFGAATESALKSFQRDHGINPDGEYGTRTISAMHLALTNMKNKVAVTGDSVNVRAAPSTAGRILGVVHKGDTLPYQHTDRDGWHLVEYKRENAWISGKYSIIE